MKPTRFGAESSKNDPSKLKNILNQTDLSEKDNALYEVLDGLIAHAGFLRTDLDGKLSNDALINPKTQFSGKVPTSFGGIQTGSYVPLFNLTANVLAAGVDLFYWTRAGDYISVFGKIQINVSLIATLTRLRISIPVVSYFDWNYECAGYAVSDTVDQQGAIKADVINREVELSFPSTSIGIFDMYLNFSYRIVAQ